MFLLWKLVTIAYSNMSENLKKSTENEILENNFLLFIDSNIHSLNPGKKENDLELDKLVENNNLHVNPPRSSDGKHDSSTSDSDDGAT